MPTADGLWHRTQVLLRLRPGEKLWQRGLRLIRKISKARRIVPSSYILQEDCIHVGDDRYYGGFAVVSNGEYQGHAVAIKHLQTNEGGQNNIFKVPLINLANYNYLAFA